MAEHWSKRPMRVDDMGEVRDRSEMEAQHAAAFREGVLTERERCVKIVGSSALRDVYPNLIEKLAELIRKGSGK